MIKIRLTKEEKTVMRSIQQKGNEKPLCMMYDTYYLCVLSLTDKRIVDSIVDYDKIIDVKLSYMGSSYLAVNPTLRNPIDWYKVITTSAVILTAIATTVALFAGCKALGA